jgi:hypothetical protein
MICLAYDNLKNIRVSKLENLAWKKNLWQLLPSA